jgi:hypothetical protein
MSIGSRVVGVGGHQPLLDSEHEVVSCMKGCSGHRWIAPSDAQLQSADCLTQRRRRFGLVVQAECLDIV